jgi:hypothetical protein
MRFVLLIVAGLGIAGCASKSNEIAPSYVSPMIYQSYTCQQIAMEAQNVSAHAAEVAGAQDDKRTKDQIATGVAVVVFWPAAFLVGGDGQAAAELARLKGSMQALEQASVMKNCGIQFRQAPPTQ